MLVAGQKIRFCKNDAVILNCTEDEVLIYIEAGYIKWVNKGVIELTSVQME